ncbi:hypothetical protein NDI56_16720 [Haloarcula sp. S1CR25-12]|uniref:Uncharacterized protein n=1 Tax=Haloarcula saliterrae TaxID=2950534 RepID=A0ABU2FFK5_9EURY|nr:hypothetical protein [Haloarcula sp. S1CR25-12]
MVLGYPMGYSDITAEEHTNIVDWRGRRVHLLGASPPKQYPLIEELTQPRVTGEEPANIVGVDWNGIIRLECSARCRAGRRRRRVSHRDRSDHVHAPRELRLRRLGPAAVRVAVEPLEQPAVLGPTAFSTSLDAVQRVSARFGAIHAVLRRV